MPGGSEDCQWAELVAVRQRHSGFFHLSRGYRDVAEPSQQPFEATAVVCMIMRNCDPAGAATDRCFTGQTIKMRVDRGTWIDDPTWVAADQPAVRSIKRERAWVLGPHALNIELLKQLHPASLPFADARPESVQV